MGTFEDLPPEVLFQIGSEVARSGRARGTIPAILRTSRRVRDAAQGSQLRERVLCMESPSTDEIVRYLEGEVRSMVGRWHSSAITVAYATPYALDGIKPLLRDNVDPDGEVDGQLASYSVPLSVSVTVTYDPLNPRAPLSLATVWRMFNLTADDPDYLDESQESSFYADEATPSLTAEMETTRFPSADPSQVAAHLRQVMVGGNASVYGRDAIGGIWLTRYEPGVPVDLATLRGVISARPGCEGGVTSAYTTWARRWLGRVDVPLITDPDDVLTVTNPLEAATRATELERGEFRDYEEGVDEEKVDVSAFLPEVNYLGEAVALLRLMAVLDVITATKEADVEVVPSLVQGSQEVRTVQEYTLQRLLSVLPLLG
jgi:hypothetical protein